MNFRALQPFQDCSVYTIYIPEPEVTIAYICNKSEKKDRLAFAMLI